MSLRAEVFRGLQHVRLRSPADLIDRHLLQGGLRQKSQAMQFERMTNLGRVADRRQ